MKTLISYTVILGLFWLSAWIGHTLKFNLGHWWAFPYLATCMIVIIGIGWIAFDKARQDEKRRGK